ncbi:tyrosine-type recombinase/integrase [Sinorhizobium fredii]|uniref:tyrosine-type recombinase/integrase n=1 Tax=Rhizobium fredii TaxID=380 RepID=UPI001873346F|nr:tyrosine-type recombinase/integrase [Sinorhizobium fredii]
MHSVRQVYNRSVEKLAERAAARRPEYPVSQCQRPRHTMAMDLLQAGVDRAVIALCLGHESVETTQIYLEATLAMKEAALAKTSPYSGKSSRFRPDDNLLGFLNSL